MASQLRTIEIQAGGEATGKKWRVWMDGHEVTHFLTDLSVKTGINEVSEVTLVCRARVVTLETPRTATGDEHAGNH